jgi:hypothetical protein
MEKGFCLILVARILILKNHENPPRSKEVSMAGIEGLE